MRRAGQPLPGCAKNAGRPPAPSIVHNDYRFDNVILDATTHAHHRRAGLGNGHRRPADGPGQQPGLLDRSRRPGAGATDAPPAKQRTGHADPPPVRRLLRRARRHPLDNFDFYYRYGLFRLAGIVQQIYYRFYHGQTQDKRFAQFIHMNRCWSK
jgi:hypothetical protein